MTEGDVTSNGVPVVASEISSASGGASSGSETGGNRHTWRHWLDARWLHWGSPVADGLALVTQWLFLLTVLALPLDGYLTLPAHGSGIFVSQVLTLETFGLLVLALVAGWLAWRQTGLRFRWADVVPLGLVLLAAGASVVSAVSRAEVVKECLKVAVLLALYVVARSLRGMPGIRFRALAAILGGFVIVVVLGLIQTRPGVADFSGILLNIQRTTAGVPVSGVIRAEATFRYPNELAAYLLLVLPLVAAAVAQIPWLFERSATAVLLALGLWLLLATYTRGALLAALVAAPLLLLGLGFRRWAVLGSIAAALLLGFVVLRGGALSSRLLSLLSPSDAGYTTRLAAWRWAISAFLHHPFTGIGLGNLKVLPGAPYIDPANGVREVDAENLILNVLAEMGVLGLGAVIYCLVGAFRSALAGLRESMWRETDDWVDQTWNIGTFVALCALLVYGIGDPVLASGQVTGLLCVLIGLVGPRISDHAMGEPDVAAVLPGAVKSPTPH